MLLIPDLAMSRLEGGAMAARENRSPSRISVVALTYNWPEALAVVLESLRAQDTRDFEVIVADDGSGPATRELI
jgi:cellulose synthase/poly-beta-1,6-N-acetylglucosamine synthase-like glycosyltransferase